MRHVLATACSVPEPTASRYAVLGPLWSGDDRGRCIGGAGQRGILAILTRRDHKQHCIGRHRPGMKRLSKGGGPRPVLGSRCMVGVGAECCRIGCVVE